MRIDMYILKYNVYDIIQSYPNNLNRFFEYNMYACEFRIR